MDPSMPSKSALPLAVSPTRKYGSPLSARPATSIGSPIKRRAEVHNRHQSEQSALNSNSSDRLRRASQKYQARRSNPQLSQEDIVPLLKQEQIEPLVIKKTPPISRKPIQELVKRPEIKKTRDSVTDQEPKQLLIPPRKDSLSPQLLTDVSEEDNIRRNHPRSAEPLHLSIPDRRIEIQEQFRTPSVSQGSPALSLFNLEPLAITKSSPAQSVENDAPRALINKTEPEFVTAPSTPSTPSKNPRPRSLYRPDLFSTFRGFAPIQTTVAHSNPHTVETHITVSITSPTPQKPSRRASLSYHSGNQHSNSTGLIHHSPTSLNSNHCDSPLRSSLPIASRYISALTSTKQESNFTEQLRKQASIARLRTPTSPHLSPEQPLTQWLTSLCTTNNNTVSPSSEMSGTKSDSRRERDLFQSPLLDDEMNDEEGTQKAKPTASEELGVMIDDMLNDLTGKFTAITSEIMAKMDDMGRRIDNLEASLQRDGEKVSDEDPGS